MLVLSRKVGESLRIGSEVRVTVVSISGGQVRVAVEAPPEVSVHREEVFERIVEANRAAAAVARQGWSKSEGEGAQLPPRSARSEKTR